MAALHKYTSYRAALKTDVLRDQLQQQQKKKKRQRDKNAAEFYTQTETNS